MNARNAGILMVAALLSIVAVQPAFAAPFEPQFTVAKITGTCEVQLPGTNVFAAAAEGAVLPYGTVIKTAAGSSCVLRFSEDNGCLVYEATTVEVSEAAREKKHKILKLSEGGVEINLEKEFHKRNKLTVLTPCAACEAIGCAFSMDHKVVGDLKTSTIRCTEGEVRSRGRFHDIIDIGANDQVTVSESPDGNFIRVKSSNGDFTVVTLESDRTEKKTPMTTNDELTIVASDSKENANAVIVVYKLAFADTQKEPLVWQTTVPKPAVAPPAGEVMHLMPKGEDNEPAKWSALTVAPPIPTVTPVGKQ